MILKLTEKQSHISSPILKHRIKYIMEYLQLCNYQKYKLTKPLMRVSVDLHNQTLKTTVPTLIQASGMHSMQPVTPATKIVQITNSCHIKLHNIQFNHIICDVIIITRI